MKIYKISYYFNIIKIKKYKSKITIKQVFGYEYHYNQLHYRNIYFKIGKIFTFFSSLLGDLWISLLLKFHWLPPLRLFLTLISLYVLYIVRNSQYNKTVLRCFYLSHIRKLHLTILIHLTQNHQHHHSSTLLYNKMCCHYTASLRAIGTDSVAST